MSLCWLPMGLFGHRPEVVNQNELLEPVCLTWRLEQKVGASLGPLNEAKVRCIILLFSKESICFVVADGKNLILTLSPEGARFILSPDMHPKLFARNSLARFAA